MENPESIAGQRSDNWPAQPLQKRKTRIRTIIYVLFAHDFFDESFSSYIYVVKLNKQMKISLSHHLSLNLTRDLESALPRRCRDS